MKMEKWPDKAIIKGNTGVGTTGSEGFADPQVLEHVQG